MVWLYSLGCIQTLPTCQRLMTLIIFIIQSFLSSEQITLTLSVQWRYLLTYSYDIALLYSLGCIQTLPTLQTLITLIIKSFLLSEQITLTLSVQQPYLLTYSYDTVLLYSLGCIHTIATRQNTDYTDYTGCRIVCTICTGNVNAICATTISSNIQLWYCIAIFPRLYPKTTYMPNTGYTDYTDNTFVLIIWTENVNAICATTISSNLQLWYCIAVFPRLYTPNTYLPHTDYTDYTGYRVVFNHLHR